MDFLRKQVIDKDARVQELLLEKAELEEKHAAEVDEITETGVNEISELEVKLEQAQEQLKTVTSTHEKAMGEQKDIYEAQIDE